MPFDNFFDTCLDLFTIFSIEKDKPLLFTPKSLAFLKYANISEDLNKALVGIHPQFKQIPPSSLFSITKTFCFN